MLRVATLEQQLAAAAAERDAEAGARRAEAEQLWEALSEAGVSIEVARHEAAPRVAAAEGAAAVARGEAEEARRTEAAEAAEERQQNRSDFDCNTPRAPWTSSDPHRFKRAAREPSSQAPSAWTKALHPRPAQCVTVKV